MNKFTVRKVSKEEHDKIMNDPTTIIKVSKKDMNAETLLKIINDLEVSAMVNGKARIEVVE